ncbi:MAG: hypothetical protein ABSE16_01495 [Verrucomicrobiota bacterium]
MRAAKAWGLSPRQWRLESVDDRALMLAFVLFEATLESRRQEYREEVLERKRGKDGAASDFERMKRRFRVG